MVRPNEINLQDCFFFLQEHGKHVSVSKIDGGLVYASYSGYRDPRLTDEQVAQIQKTYKWMRSNGVPSND